MSRGPAWGILRAMANEVWAIRREALETMIAVASREPFLRQLEGAGEVAVAPVPAPRALLSLPLTPHARAERLGVHGPVGVLPIHGPLCRYSSFIQEVCGMTSYAQAAADLRVALEDSAIRGVMLHFDSPGGEVNGCAELAEQILAARGRKPLVAMVSGGAGSAAYWLAAGCDEIVVAPQAYVGSIGAMFEIVDFSEYEAREGIQRIRIVSAQSPNKAPDIREASGRAQVQRIADQVADAFIASAAAARGMTPEQLIAAGDGGAVFIGRFAVERGLADRVASSDATLAALAAQVASGSLPAASPADARAAAQPQEPQMSQPSAPTAGLPAPRALAAGEEARSLVTRETTVNEGAEGPVEEMREGVSVARITTPDGPSGWLIVGEEVEAVAAGETTDDGEEGGGSASEDDEEREEANALATAIAAMTAAHPAAAAALRRQAQAQAVRAERARVLGLCALDARQITPTLRAAIESGQGSGRTAQALLEASRTAGAQAVAAMVQTEQQLAAPAPLAPAPATPPSPAAAIIALVEQHSPDRRGRRAALN